MKLKLLTIITFILAIFVFITSPIKSQTFNIPPECPTTYIPDFNCQYQKILDPETDCDENICPGQAGIAKPEEYRTLVSFFGKGMYIYSDAKIVSLINLAVTTFLGFVSIFALIYGIYIAGYVRVNTTDAAKITETNKILQRLIMGFILAWSFIFIMQLLMNFLGLGSLRETVVFGDTPQGTSTIVIE